MQLFRNVLIFAALTTILGILKVSEVRAMDDEQPLSARQRSIVTIAAFTASGDMDRLNDALVEGLDAGLTVNEIKEVLIQMYAYAGFPRSLNGLNAFMSLLKERQADEIDDEIGSDASPLPADLDKDDYGARVRASLAGVEDIPPPAEWQKFAPAIDVFLKEHLFADIFARDVLDHQNRELATISALANMHGTSGQLYFHFAASMNVGLTEAQMHDFISVLRSEVGESQAESASKVLQAVIGRRN